MARNILRDGSYTNSQYTKNLAQWKADDEEYTYWESQFLNPLKSTYEAAEQTAKTTAGYDITNAYKNYLNYQTQLAQSNLLGTSQSKLNESAKSGYESSYATALQDYYKSTASAYKDYQSGLAKAQEEISSIGKNLKSFDEYMNKYVAGNYSSYGYSEEDIKNMYSKNELGEDVLTDLGRNVYANILETIDTDTGRNKFYDYLKNEDESLYDFALENPDMLKEVLFGYSSDEAEDKSKYKYNLEYLENKLNIADTKDVIDVGRDPDNRLTTPSGEKNYGFNMDMLIDIGGDKYGFKNNMWTADANVINSPELQEYANRVGLKDGSIVTINGKYYMYTTFNGTRDASFAELILRKSKNPKQKENPAKKGTFSTNQLL